MILKKFGALCLTAALSLGLVACSGNSDVKPAESNQAQAKQGEKKQETKTFNIGVAIYQYKDNFMTAYRTELDKYFKELSKDGVEYKVEFQDGNNDQIKQTEQINTFINQGKDLIIANLVDPTAATQVINSAKSANIPVILINREPRETKTMEIWPGKSTYVGVDARQSGVYQGEIIAELPNKGDLNGDGKVNYIMIMGDAGNVDAEQRTQYSVETLQKTIPAEILGEAQRGDWDEEKGQAITANALAQFGDQLEVVFANNDGMAKGAVTAIKGAHRTVNKDIYVVGVDALPEVVELVGKGEFTGTVLNDGFNQSHTAADIAVKLLNGEDVKPYYWHDYVKVTKAGDESIKRVEARAETIEEYTKRLKDTYGA